MPRRRATTGALLAGLVLLAGCGGGEPEALEPLPPEVPADLCAEIPESLRSGLLTAHTTSMAGNPTAACSLRSAPDAAQELRATITWTHYDTDLIATDVLASQCRAIDTREYKVQPTLSVAGSDQTCGGTGRESDTTTLAAASGREVLTVRVGVDKGDGGQQQALERGRKLLESVLASMETGA